MSNPVAWLAAGVLACAAVTGATETAQPLIPVAQSALVTLRAATSPGGLTLHLERTAGRSSLIVTDLTVSIDGAKVPATRAADGSWSVAWPHAGGRREGHLEAVVAHDGIRELLTGSIPPSAAGTPAGTGAGASLWRDHKQLAWWVLNIVVVLIAALALSRRMS